MKLLNKGHMIAKCFVFQIAMSLLGFFVISAVVNAGKMIILLAGLFTILFYFAITGTALNEDGLKDSLIQSRNNEKTDAFLGMKYVALSYIPSFLMTLIIAVFRTFDIAVEVADALVMIVKFFFTGMFFGIDMTLFISGVDEKGYAVYSFFSNNCYSLLVYQILSIVICGMFYYIGVKGINLLKTKEKK